jgi:hypothetical protein
MDSENNQDYINLPMEDILALRMLEVRLEGLKSLNEAKELIMLMERRYLVHKALSQQLIKESWGLLQEPPGS